MARILLIGPSGSGKTTIVEHFPTRVGAKHYQRLDLDLFGYHAEVARAGEMKWLINRSAVAAVLNKPHVLAAGIAENVEEIATMRSDVPFEPGDPPRKWNMVVILKVDPEELARRGVRRDEARNPQYRKSKEMYLSAAQGWNERAPELRRHIVASGVKVQFWDISGKSIDSVVTRLIGLANSLA